MKADLQALSLLDAQASAEMAKLDFDATAKQHGVKVALHDFNRRVLRWSREIEGFRYQRLMYVLGTMMSGRTHSFHASNHEIRCKQVRRDVLGGRVAQHDLATYQQGRRGRNPEPRLR